MVINMFGRVCIDLKKQRTPKLKLLWKQTIGQRSGKERGAPRVRSIEAVDKMKVDSRRVLVIDYFI